MCLPHFCEIKIKKLNPPARHNFSKKLDDNLGIYLLWPKAESRALWSLASYMYIVVMTKEGSVILGSTESLC
jgi:hypothetical protein